MLNGRGSQEFEEQCPKYVSGFLHTVGVGGSNPLSPILFLSRICILSFSPFQDHRGDDRVPEDFVLLREVAVGGQMQRFPLRAAWDKPKKKMRAIPVDRDDGRLRVIGIIAFAEGIRRLLAAYFS
jgi:hypothetical protein